MMSFTTLKQWRSTVGTPTTIYCGDCRGLTPVNSVDCREDSTSGYLYCVKCWKKRG